ncbi:MAG: ATP-binding protein [bacterium]|nr:ATP-binding protein [bacterium]
MGCDVLELRIQSSYDELEQVVNLLGEAAKQLCLTEEDEADLMISVMEAVNNAIQHGNREDQNKLVYIRIQMGSGEITVSVEDEGGGFEPGAVPDPREPKNLMNVSGRGILMMKAFMDRVEFEPAEQGTRVTMTKRFVTH